MSIMEVGPRPLFPALSKSYDTENSTKLYNKEIILHFKLKLLE